MLIYLARAVVLRFREGRCLQVAGSLTFTTLLALVPLVTLVAVVFSRLPQSVRFGEVLRGFLLENLLPDRAGQGAEIVLDVPRDAARILAARPGAVVIVPEHLASSVRAAAGPFRGDRVLTI